MAVCLTSSQIPRSFHSRLATASPPPWQNIEGLFSAEGETEELAWEKRDTAEGRGTIIKTEGFS